MQVNWRASHSLEELRVERSWPFLLSFLPLATRKTQGSLLVALPGSRARAIRCRQRDRVDQLWRKGSVPSLAAGLLFGGLAGLGAYQQSQDPKNVWLSLIASGTLTGVMGMRFYNSRKFMPAGLIAGASLLMVGKLGLQMMEKPLQP
uniref:Transmembrane protein 14C n=1 Tax=Anolis carolinensis TaxID=28377 RepID=A0A803TIP5_ANOCA